MQEDPYGMRQAFAELMPGAARDAAWGVLPEVCAETAEKVVARRERQQRRDEARIRKLIFAAERLAAAAERLNNQHSMKPRVYLNDALSNYRRARVALTEKR